MKIEFNKTYTKCINEDKDSFILLQTPPPKNLDTPCESRAPEGMCTTGLSTYFWPHGVFCYVSLR